MPYLPPLIDIIVLFWQTQPAYVVYVAIVLLLLFLLFHYRTRNLRIANQILREKELASKEIARQKEELSLKNRNITDSINYAKRIQMALMPNEKTFSRLFKDSFIYYKPKDIVSGDFYWINKKNDKLFFAVADCTGHGVPGAFMSIIGFELLRNIIFTQKLEEPASILNQLNSDFTAVFHDGGKSGKEMTFRDGMDLGFCVIDKKNSVLEYAGAFMPLYLIRNNTITEIKGDRSSIGLIYEKEKESFSNHRIKLEENDVIYLFSDGYADQFGGEKGKKFKYRRFRYLLLNIHTLPMEKQKELLDQSMAKWMKGCEQVDDILIIGLKPGMTSGGQ